MSRKTVTIDPSKAVELAGKFLPETIFEGMTDRQRAVAEHYLAYPDKTMSEIGGLCGETYAYVWKVVRENRFLNAVAVGCRGILRRNLPKATNVLVKMLDSNSEDAKLKAATKILENEDVLGPTKVDVFINDLKNRPIEELQAIVARASKIPAPTIDAELL